MSHFYRLTVFGNPRGPWRTSRRRAQADAIEAEAGSFAEDGRFYLDAGAEFQCVHEYEFMRRGEECPSSYRKIPGRESGLVLRRA